MIWAILMLIVTIAIAVLIDEDKINQGIQCDEIYVENVKSVF
jgi:hypothetical protein